MQILRIAQRQLAAKSSPDHDPHESEIRTHRKALIAPVTNVEEIAHRIHSAVMVLQFVDSIAPQHLSLSRRSPSSPT